MKNKNTKIDNILKETERKLQKAISIAANKGDYSVVEKARTTAVEICNIRSKLTIYSPQREETSVKVKPSDYPRFEVISNELIRTGWSKKQQVEYAHKIKKSSFDKIVKVMAELAQSATGPISAETIINRIEDMESGNIPSYQIYVVMGLLKNKNCIKQKGRKGYEILPDIEIKAEKQWRNLTS